jgi:hypothetical protein
MMARREKTGRRRLSQLDVSPMRKPGLETVGEAGLGADLRAALRALEIAALIAQRKFEMVPIGLRELLDLVSAQPQDFQVGWDWAGTVHFVQTDERVAPVRDWLLSLFEALQGKDRASTLEGIQNATASLATVSKP